jgi:quercetin dioxygenase-like cupin family protein
VNAQMLLTGIMSAALMTAAEPTLAQELTKPVTMLKEVVTGMPRGDKQEIRVLTASFVPGQATVFHTHRFPVTVFMLEGTFTLEMEGRPPVAIKAGQSFVEPANVRMTGYNRSTTEPIKLVIFYASDPDTPFLDVVANK